MAKADHVFVSHGIYTHHGIDFGDGSVVHLSRASGKVCQVNLDDFLRGRRLLSRHWEDGYEPDIVLERAYSRLGEPGYNLAYRNCEHFASWCKSGIAHSSQVKRVERRVAAGSGKLVAPWVTRTVLTRAAVTLAGRSLVRSASPALLIADAAQLGTEVFLSQRGLDPKQVENAGAGVGLAGSVAIGAALGGPVGGCVGAGLWAIGEGFARCSRRPALVT
jgi:hypothetical protein